MPGRPNRGQSRAGFTFVEVLAALLFLAIVVPAVVEALTIANRASVMSERHALAGEYAENKLNELMLDDAWSNAPATSGSFGSGYRWEMKTSNWTADTVNPMTELVVNVYYTVQGHEYNVHLSTLVSQPGAASGASTSGTATTS
jgi:type II secretory pathway pseudopilin PulG